MKKISIHLQLQSSPIEYENVINTYSKGEMFCIYYVKDDAAGIVDKYPISSIFRVREAY